MEMSAPAQVSLHLFTRKDSDTRPDLVALENFNNDPVDIELGFPEGAWRKVLSLPRKESSSVKFKGREQDCGSIRLDPRAMVVLERKQLSERSAPKRERERKPI